MTINYTQVFNSVLQQKVSQQTAREQLVKEVEGHLVELESILSEVIDAEQFEHTTVEYINDEKLLCFECHSECMEIKFDAEQMQMSIAVKVVSFNVDESTAGNNYVEVSYENEQDAFISRDADGNIVYDLGADNRSVSEFYTYVVERAAEMVARG